MQDQDIVRLFGAVAGPHVEYREHRFNETDGRRYLEITHYAPMIDRLRVLSVLCENDNDVTIARHIIDLAQMASDAASWSSKGTA